MPSSVTRTLFGSASRMIANASSQGSHSCTAGSIGSISPSSQSRITSDCSTSKTSLVMLPASTWAFSVAGGLSLSTIVVWMPVSAVKGLAKASFTAAPKAPRALVLAPTRELVGQIQESLAPLAEAGDGVYYTAEPEHQQYLEKNPTGYCNHGFNGVACSL